MNRIAKRINVNRSIRAKEVRLIDAQGGQAGVVSLTQALAAAEAVGLDLVEVAPQVTPPVCRIMDYGRFKYQQSKKLQEAKKKSAGYQVKEIKVRPNTGENDLQVKIRKIRGFLSNKDKVKVSIMFRGREMAYIEQGMAILKRISEETADLSMVEQEAKREGRQMFMILAHK